jgi:hypothetical protein
MHTLVIVLHALMPSENMFVHEVGLVIPRARPQSRCTPMGHFYIACECLRRALQTMASLQVDALQ